MDPNNVYMLVLDTLHRASSQDIEVLKPAEKKLTEWEVEPGYYSILQSVFSNHSVDTNVRWLAAVTFKNGIDRYWRKNAPNGISEEEKQKLRQALLTPTLLTEPVNQVASQLAVLVAKIARFDCPNEWSEVVPCLLTAMKMNGTIEQHRALLIFYHVVKALSTKRLLADKRIFQELTNNVFSYVLGMWDEFTQLFLRQIQESATTEAITESLEKALYSLNILKKLTIYGFKNPHISQDAITFLNLIFDRAKTSLECRKLLKGRGVYLLELCEKYIVNLMKVALGTLEFYPLSYISLLAPSLEFTTYYCFTEQGMHLAFERFTVQCLNLLKAILLCTEYKSKGLAQLRDSETARASDIKISILTDQLVGHMCRTLVTHFFLLTSDDLALWDADSESFATEFICGTWKCNLRPCVESLYLALFYEFRDLMKAEVLSLLKMVRQEGINPHDLPTILRKDAVYNAVGQIANDLYDEIDFNEWLTTQLIEELKIKDDNYRIIRRRTAWLIGTWSRVQVSTELRPIIYQAFLELLSETEDVAVRLAAGDALSMTIDDYNFSSEQFAPFVRPVFTMLLNLLKNADECDTKMHILNVLSFVVERNGAVMNHTSELLSYLPLLWDHASQHNMLRCAIVSNLVQLVKALGYWVTPEMQALVLGVLDEATNPKKPAYVYLLEDGLELWQAVLEVTPTPFACADQLLHLSQNLPPLLDETTEYLRLSIHIANAYILLMPVEFLKGAGGEFMRKLDSLLSDMQVVGIVKIYKLAEVCLKIQIPEPNEALGIQVIWPLLSKVITMSSDVDNEQASLVTLRFSLISRLLLRSVPLFLEAVKDAGIGWSADPSEILLKLLDSICSRLSLVVQTDRRKLIGLGLGVLLTSQIPCVLQKFPMIMSNITEILNDVMKSSEEGEYIDGLLVLDTSPPSPCGSCNSFFDSNMESQHDIRSRQVMSMDVVHAVDIKTFITNQLNELQNQVGKKTFTELMATIRRETLEELSYYIPINL